MGQVAETFYDDLSMDRVTYNQEQDQMVYTTVTFIPAEDDGILRTFIDRYTSMLIHDLAYMEELRRRKNGYTLKEEAINYPPAAINAVIELHKHFVGYHADDVNNSEFDWLSLLILHALFHCQPSQNLHHRSFCLTLKV